MRTFNQHPPATVFLDIGHTSLKLSNGRSVTRVALAREPSGRMTAASRESTLEALRDFQQANGLTAGTKAFCGIQARGVSLRRLEIPPAPQDALTQLLNLQIEKEFPLPPDQLAWGCRKVEGGGGSAGDGAAGQSFLVVAVKQEAVEEYKTLLKEAGLLAVFTPGVMAAGSMCPRQHGAWALLDVGRSHSELAVFEGNDPVSVRSLTGCGDDMTRSMATALSVTEEEAERIKCGQTSGLSLEQEQLAAIDKAAANVADSLAAAVRCAWAGRRLFVSGGGARVAGLVPSLARALGAGYEVVPLVGSTGAAGSTVLDGLRQGEARGGTDGLILLTRHDGATEEAVASVKRSEMLVWTALAACLLIACFSLRYAGAFLRKPALEKRVAEIRLAKKNLPEIDRELTFLQYLETNQPPYLAIVSTLSDAAARGSKMNLISLNRRGELSLKATLGSADQATELRTKLIASGVFSNVVVEEQTPNQNRQVSVRMSAQWKPGKELRAEPLAKPGSTNAPPARVAATPSKPKT